MSTITLEEAQAHLSELVHRLKPGEELLILSENLPVAKLVGQRSHMRPPRQPGRQKDQILHMADDFDAPLEDFKEYMQ